MKTILYLIIALLICFVVTFALSPFLNDTAVVLIGAGIITLFATYYRKWEQKYK